MATLIFVFLHVVGATFLLFRSWEGFFIAGLAVFMYGQAFLWIALDRRLSRIRLATRFGSSRAFRLHIAANMVAGGLGALGAITTLHPVFAAIIVWFVVCWVLLMAWLYRLTARETWPHLQATNGRNTVL
jgi:hypothetical protein